MDVRTVGDLFTRERRTDRPALEDETGRVYDAHWLRTSAWKAGNFLRHTGVRRGVTVAVAGRGPHALLAFFGTALLEGRTRFGPPTDLASAADLRTVVAPVDDLGAYDLPRGVQRVGYGGEPDDPEVRHFDAGLWSENPSFPPLAIDPDAPLLSDGERAYDHGACIAAARDVVARVGLETGDRVELRAPLSTPETVVAGVLAPLLVDAVIVLPGEEPDAADVVVGEHAAVESGSPNPDFRRIVPESVDIG